ncbi:nitronate monooxygenase [Dactylosporangium roseum]|uniref:Nitronate monooxygenase n=1 Tax=Dactylosporangium roseum TaxID=47989 RepID=A0ABY5ZI11_9ACTN|nr:nitronate monooxygenase [Dactylosporangium roseum]
MRSPVCEMFGTRTAIFGFTPFREVVVALGNAGGYGVLGASRRTPEVLDADLRWISENGGGHPFGVDIVYPATSAGDDLGAMRSTLPAEHVEFVNRLMDRFEIPKGSDPDRGDLYAAHRLTMANARAQTEVALAHDPSFVVSALGVPPPDIMDAIHAKGAFVGALVGSPKHALRQVEAGVDVIVAQGNEAGGHVGRISTMVLVPQVVDAVGDVPVLAAGGIGDGRQVAAAEALGAAGVWLGSILLTTVESQSAPVVKRKLLQATSDDTLVTKSFSGKSARVLRTPWFDAWESREAPSLLKAPLQGLLVSEAMTSMVENEHDLVTSPVGQIIGMVDKEESVGVVMDRLLAQYAAARTRVG